MKRKAHPPEHMGELNIVPYLDIVVNLVMFMLMSMTGFITFNMINVTTPDLSDDSAVSSTPPPKDEKQEEEFVLNISIASNGFFIAATGGVLGADEPAEKKEGDDKAAPTIPLKATYTDRSGAQKSCEGLARPPADCYDYEALALKMAAIKARRPDKSQYFLAADKAVSYATVVQTMDATRGDAQHPLFPDVAFAAVQ